MVPTTTHRPSTGWRREGCSGLLPCLSSVKRHRLRSLLLDEVILARGGVEGILLPAFLFAGSFQPDFARDGERFLAPSGLPGGGGKTEEIPRARGSRGPPQPSRDHRLPTIPVPGRAG